MLALKSFVYMQKFNFKGSILSRRKNTWNENHNKVVRSPKTIRNVTVTIKSTEKLLFINRQEWKRLMHIKSDLDNQEMRHIGAWCLIIVTQPSYSSHGSNEGMLHTPMLQLTAVQCRSLVELEVSRLEVCKSLYVFFYSRSVLQLP